FALSDLKGRSPAGEIAALKLADVAVIAVGDHVTNTHSYNELKTADATKSVHPYDVRASDPFLQLYTSGTTSAPKAVSVTYNHCLSNARMCAQEFGIVATDRVLCLAPYTHLYGLYALELGFSAGATACLVPMFTPGDFIAALVHMKPTVLIGGPAHVAVCMQQRLFDRDVLSAIRFCVLS